MRIIGKDQVIAPFGPQGQVFRARTPDRSRMGPRGDDHARGFDLGIAKHHLDRWAIGACFADPGLPPLAAKRQKAAVHPVDQLLRVPDRARGGIVNRPMDRQA